VGEADHLTAKLQALEQLFVFVEVVALDIIEQLAAPTGHGDEATTAVEILAMGTQVFGEMRDALREQGNLDFR